jgi:hypothetical protein
MEFRRLIRRCNSRLPPACAPAFARVFSLAVLVLAGAVLVLAGAAFGAGDAAGAGPRVEARSADLLAVGLVQGDRMSIHVSRLLDNAPLRDAVVAVVLRGATHPTVAEADGSYTLVAKDLTLTGAAALEFQVTQGQLHENLKGVLQVASPKPAPDDRSNSRQMWWWALNFGVCIGFLVLISRRKKSAQT